MIMSRKFFVYLLLLLFPHVFWAQGENNIWTFSPEGGNSNLVLNFNLTPVDVSAVLVVSAVGYSSAVCFPNGALRFMVRMTTNSPSGTLMNLFQPDGTPIPNSNLLTGMLTDGCMPVVIPRPGNADQYYIIYSYSNGLLYTLLDMSLNGGTGGIVSGQKNLVLAPYGSVMAEKMTAVQGCNGIWLVVHGRITNGYYSYHVTASGMDTSGVYSPVSNFPLQDYYGIVFPDFLKVSHDGNHIASTSWKGIEIYDFEKCSGKLKNARVIDTTGNILPSGQTIYNNYTFRDVCFSPDGTKFYATQNHMDGTAEPVAAGKLYQYDLSLSTPSAVQNSKTLIMTNYPSLTPDISMLCIHIAQNPLGEMKLGPDGKIYIDNGSYTCKYPANVPPGFNPGAAFHTISQPNLPGLACLPQFNTVVANGFNNSYEKSFFVSGFSGSAIQQNIVVAPLPPDTIIGLSYFPYACFTDSLKLFADSTANCYLWDDGSTERERMVFRSGTYFVHYFKDCNYSTDTFHARLIRLPKISAYQSCPGMFMGRIQATVDSSGTSLLNYIWETADGGIIRQHLSNSGDTIKGLDSGIYKLRLTSDFGCDTTLLATIINLPKPFVVAFPRDTTIRYGDSLLIHVAGALLYAWSPSASLDSANKADPIAKPLQPTLYAVIGIAQNGCLDTGYLNVNIDYTMPDFVPNAFSPNGDGLNDVFGIAGITYQKVTAFRIFNRFGQEVFSTVNGQVGWDGTQNGKPCDVGTYYYFIELDYPDGKRKIFKGDLTLIR
jgi:gliding motility-associated-like protein